MFPNDYFSANQWTREYWPEHGDPLVIPPTSSVRTAVNQPPDGGTDYPFTVPNLLGPLIPDFYLAYTDDEDSVVPPLRLYWVYGLGEQPGLIPGDVPHPTHTRDILVIDDLGQYVFDSSRHDVTLHETPWGTNRVIVEWISTTAVARLVFFKDQAAVMPWALRGNATLDYRTYLRMPHILHAIQVGTDVMTGIVTLMAGHNVALSGSINPHNDGGVYGGTINLDGVAGAGQGRLDGCGDTTPVRTINGIGPDASGNLTLEANDCFRMQLPLTVAGTHAHYGTDTVDPDAARAAVQLYNDCVPCCTCDEFARTYMGVKRLWDRYSAIATMAEAVRDSYARSRDRWLAQRDCRMASPLRGTAVTEPSCNSFIAGQWCNMTKCCVPNPELRFTVQVYTNGVLDLTAPEHLDVFNAFISSALTGGADLGYIPIVYERLSGGPVVSFHLGMADPQHTIVVKFRLHLMCDSTQAMKITITAHSPDPTPNPLGEICTLPLLAVPDELATIWSAAAVPASPLRAITVVTIPMNSNPPQFVALE